MRKKERAEIVLERLNEQYPETPVPLDHSDAFTLLIAVLLSAQCTDKKVNEVTPALFAAGPTPDAMAALEPSEILASPAFGSWGWPTPRPRTCDDWRNCSLSVTAVRFPRALKPWKRCLEWGTKPPAW